MIFLLSFCNCVFVYCAILRVEKLYSGDEKYCIPKIIWEYWDKEMPDDIVEMVNVTRNSLENFTFYLLSENNISGFLDLSLFPSFHAQLWKQGKTDYIRVCLLEKYGGLWLDCSTYVNSGVEMEWFFFEAVRNKGQFSGFTVANRKYQITMGFIAAPENSVFIRRLRKEMEVVISAGISPDIRRVCQELKKFESYKPKLCFNYHYIDLLYAKLLLTDSFLNMSVILFPIIRSPYRLYAECGENYECGKYRLLHDVKTRNIPFIKLGGKHMRDKKRFYFREGRYLNNVSYEHWVEKYGNRSKKVRDVRKN